MMLNRSFPRSSLSPISANATPETKRVLRWVADMGRRKSCAFGISDMLKGDSSVDSPSFYEHEALFGSNSGGAYPSIVGFEYHDPLWTAAWGQTGTDMVAAKIIAAANAGRVIMLHHHMGHPVTGALSRTGTYVWPPQVDGNAGKSWDTTTGALTSINTGNAQEAQFLAYMDRLAAFLDVLIDSRGRKIPVILRWMHEANGAWFWWGENAAGFKVIWKKFVGYMKDVKGVTNVLYCPCFTTNISMGGWYPGDDYADMISLDNYDNGSAPAFTNSGLMLSRYNEATAATSKPLVVAELGYQNWTSYNNPTWQNTVQSITTTFPRVAAALMWRSPFGPGSSDSASRKADFAAALTDPRAVTLRW